MLFLSLFYCYLVVLLPAFSNAQTDPCSTSYIPPQCKSFDTSSQAFVACRTVSTLLHVFYDSTTHRFKDDGGWWNIANTIEALINFLDLAYDSISTEPGFQDWLAVVYNVTDAEVGRIQQGYDDIQWWSLTMFRLYEFSAKHNIHGVKHDEKYYLTQGQKFYDYVWNNAWDTQTCNGGLWWNLAKTYKNAITNELGLANAYTLATLPSGNQQKYATQFNQLWNWFYAYNNTGAGMLNQQNLINDGLSVNSNNKRICTNNKQTEWTYNQGVILGALAHKYTDGGQTPVYFDVSWNIIQAVMKYITVEYKDNNSETVQILHELESNSDVDKSSDQTQFKGIFMRYLMYWYGAVCGGNSNSNTGLCTRSIQMEIKQFVENQMSVVLSHGQNPQCVDQFGDVWTQTFEENASLGKFGVCCMAQTTALDLFNWAFVQWPTAQKQFPLQVLSN